MSSFRSRDKDFRRRDVGSSMHCELVQCQDRNGVPVSEIDVGESDTQTTGNRGLYIRKVYIVLNYGHGGQSFDRLLSELLSGSGQAWATGTPILCQ